MNYKLRNDYVFFTKSNTPLRNKIDKDGNVIGDQIIISDKEHSVEGQLHKLESIIPAKKVEVKDDKKSAGKSALPATTTGSTGSEKQGDTGESIIPAKSEQPKTE